ncbi:hypothetical protein SAMN05877842_1204 [Ureibacillus acetophenoni]|uniref:Uncharacterized protein n=1 Tax=Ureibacillus acetophenoni TaxID=614649 RepID=A0A285UVW3_9BACL|nr:hypothetical protein SAMN05877842_1204 [Ureibacillus acetophenoni]
MLTFVPESGLDEGDEDQNAVKMHGNGPNKGDG